MINKVVIEGNEYPVVVIRKRMRNVTLRVNDNLEIEVHSSPYVSEKELLDFIHKSEEWILKQLPRKEAEARVMNEGTEGDEIYWLGEKKPFEVYYDVKDLCTVQGPLIFFSVKEKTEERIVRAFRKAAKKELEEIIRQARIPWDEQILKNAQHPEIKVNYMTSKWGVCYTARNKIVLSTRLIHYPVECTEYVLLHEYCHFIEPNHSPRFWYLVESYMPDYKKWKQLLNGSL